MAVIKRDISTPRKVLTTRVPLLTAAGTLSQERMLVRAPGHPANDMAALRIVT